MQKKGKWPRDGAQLIENCAAASSEFNDYQEIADDADSGGEFNVA